MNPWSLDPWSRPDFATRNVPRFMKTPTPMARRLRQPLWLWRLPFLRRWRAYDTPAANVHMRVIEVAPGVKELQAVSILPKVDRHGRLLDETIWLRMED